MAAPSDSAVRQRPIKLTALLVVALVALDLATKALVEGRMDRGEEWWLVDGVVGLERTSNSGIAFGLFEGRAAVWPLLVVALAGLAWIGHQTLRPRSSVAEVIPLALIAAGALGNLIDRLGDGRVTDFMAVGPWPRFNVADSSLTVGLVAVLVIPWLLEVSDSHDQP